jgi:uncharacterized protein YmfQ (DUF2313 family)
MSALGTQPLPTQAVAGGAMTVQIARAMLALIGGGYAAPQDGLNAADYLALGSSFADLRASLLNVWGQEFVASATGVTGLLTQWEQTLGLPVDTTMTDADRQARLVAFVRSAISGTPQSIESAVAAVTTSCTVVETTASAVRASDPTPTADTPRGVFLFAVVVPIGFVQSVPKNALVASIVERMKPAHTDFTIANAVGFYCDGYLDTYLDCTALGS